MKQPKGTMKTTKSHFKQFCEFGQYWVKELNLSGWEIRYQHKEGSENRACCSVHMDGRQMLLTLYTDWNEIPTTREIESASLHEVLEGVHWKLGELAEYSFASHIVEEERHRIIQMWVNYLLAKKYSKPSIFEEL